MTVGSLFSGIGGFDLGLERAGFTIQWQVENDAYCRRVLAKHWPGVPCHYDIRTIDWEFIPAVDLICGGFPCQPFSCAGQRRGAADDRYLWPEVVRCLQVQQPAWFLGENVPGLIGLGLDQVLADLEGLGYETQTLSIPACAVDAPHIRQRLWIVAHRARVQPGRQEPRPIGQRTGERGKSGALAHPNGQRQRQPTEQADASGVGGASWLGSQERDHGCGELATSETLADATSRAWELQPSERQDIRDQPTVNVQARAALPDSERSQRRENDPSCDDSRKYSNAQRKESADWIGGDSRWLPEPPVGRVAHGIPARVDRLRGLGNAIVPQIAEALGRMILEVT